MDDSINSAVNSRFCSSSKCFSIFYRYQKSAYASTERFDNCFEVYVEEYQISFQVEDEEGNIYQKAIT